MSTSPANAGGPVHICDAASPWPRPALVRLRPTEHQDELALEFVLGSGVSAVPRPRLRLVRTTPIATATLEPASSTGADADAAVLDDFSERRRTPSRELPEPTAWVARMAQAIIEVRGGLRPPHQLSRWTTHTLYGQLQQAHAKSRRNSHRPLRVSSIHVGQPADGILEASAVLTCKDRTKAMAVRFEGWDGKWLCVSADVI